MRPNKNSYLVLEEGSMEESIRDFKNLSHIKNSFLCNLKGNENGKYLVPIRALNTVFIGEDRYSALHEAFSDINAFFKKFEVYNGLCFEWITRLYGEYKKLHTDWLMEAITPFQMPDFITMLTEEGQYYPIINFWAILKTREGDISSLHDINTMVYQAKKLVSFKGINANRDFCQIDAKGFDSEIKLTFSIGGKDACLVNKLEAAVGVLKIFKQLKDD